MFEISRDKLIHGLDILNLVPEKVGLPSSEFFWIRGKGDKVTLTVASYIMGEITLTGNGKWPVKGDYFIDRRVLVPFIYASKEIKNKNSFKFEAKKNVLVISHGNRKTELVTQKEVQGYGALSKILKEKESIIPISSELRALMLCGREAAASDTTDAHLNCVYLNKGQALAVEAYAASTKVYYFGLGKTEKGKISSAIPFPLFLVDLLGNERLKHVSWRGKYITCVFDKGVIWQPVSEEARKNFPIKTIKKTIKAATSIPKSFTVSSRRLSKVMNRLSYYLQAASKQDWIVNVTGKKGEDSLTVTSSISGAKFREKLIAKETLKTDVKLNWPLDILNPSFQFLSSKTKKLTMTVRLDEKHGLSYVDVGKYWFAITSKIV